MVPEPDRPGRRYFSEADAYPGEVGVGATAFPGAVAGLYEAQQNVWPRVEAAQAGQLKLRRALRLGGGVRDELQVARLGAGPPAFFLPIAGYLCSQRRPDHADHHQADDYQVHEGTDDEGEPDHGQRTQHWQQHLPAPTGPSLTGGWYRRQDDGDSFDRKWPRPGRPVIAEPPTANVVATLSSAGSPAAG